MTQKACRATSDPLQSLQFLDQRRPLELQQISGLTFVAFRPLERAFDQRVFELGDDMFQIDAWLRQPGQPVELRFADVLARVTSRLRRD